MPRLSTTKKIKKYYKQKRILEIKILSTKNKKLIVITNK
ncbi:MAG: hypothetical protein PWQ56_276 [Patescibacteria group bacterium]|nr:hypothetical protein [Patescibacteria group bacterium]